MARFLLIWESKINIRRRYSQDYADRANSLVKELAEHNALTEEYQNDIIQLEEKLSAAREKPRMLFHRHIYANGKIRAQQDIRRLENSEVMFKFDELENRIERMEALETIIIEREREKRKNSDA